MPEAKFREFCRHEKRTEGNYNSIKFKPQRKRKSIDEEERNSFELDGRHLA